MPRAKRQPRPRPLKRRRGQKATKGHKRPQKATKGPKGPRAQGAGKECIPRLKECVERKQGSNLCNKVGLEAALGIPAPSPKVPSQLQQPLRSSAAAKPSDGKHSALKGFSRSSLARVSPIALRSFPVLWRPIHLLNSMLGAPGLSARTTSGSYFATINCRGHGPDASWAQHGRESAHEREVPATTLQGSRVFTDTA